MHKDGYYSSQIRLKNNTRLYAYITPCKNFSKNT